MFHGNLDHGKKIISIRNEHVFKKIIKIKWKKIYLNYKIVLININIILFLLNYFTCM